MVSLYLSWNIAKIPIAASIERELLARPVGGGPRRRAASAGARRPAAEALRARAAVVRRDLLLAIVDDLRIFELTFQKDAHRWISS